MCFLMLFLLLFVTFLCHDELNILLGNTSVDRILFRDMHVHTHFRVYRPVGDPFHIKRGTGCEFRQL